VLKLERREELALLTLDRPEALNALDFGVLRDLDAVLQQLASSDARALLVTGAGPKAFCAGADVKELLGRSLAQQRRGSQLGQAVFGRIDRLPMLSIAVVNGFAFGGGLELALACTFRVATRNAKLGVPEIKLGLIPGYGGTQRLPRLVGVGRALELVMTGRAVGAEEAERIGLVHRVVDGDPIAAAAAFAREMTCYSLPVLELARSAVLRAPDLPLHEGLALEADLSTLAYQTADSVEGMNAFRDKRKPRFEDR
jgi:enoyl-CoA hydratase